MVYEFTQEKKSSAQCSPDSKQKAEVSIEYGEYGVGY
jgi:hypothetical protein